MYIIFNFLSLFIHYIYFYIDIECYLCSGMMLCCQVRLNSSNFSKFFEGLLLFCTLFRYTHFSSHVVSLAAKSVTI